MHRRHALGDPGPEARRQRRDRTVGDLVLITVVAVVLCFLLISIDLFGTVAAWLHARQLVDDILALLLVLSGGIAVFAWRRWRELVAAHREIRILAGVIPLCAWCRRARNAEGVWIPLEDYVERQSEAAVSPEVCPECTRRIPGAGARRGLF